MARSIATFLAVSLALLSAFLALPGCEERPSPSTSLKPDQVYVAVPQTIGDPTADDAGTMTLSDTEATASGIMATYRGPNGAVKILYTRDGTLICDYPVGFIGPIPYGHAREDGTT